MADIAAKDLTNSGDIVKFAGARPSLVQKRRAFGPRAIDIADTRQFLILHIDQRQRFLGNQAAFSGDHRHRFADETYLVGRDHGAITQAITIIRIDVFEILARENRRDAGEISSLAGYRSK